MNCAFQPELQDAAGCPPPPEPAIPSGGESQLLTNIVYGKEEIRSFSSCVASRIPAEICPGGREKPSEVQGRQGSNADESSAVDEDQVRNHVVLLAEWDTAYGRSLPLSVAHEFVSMVKKRSGEKEKAKKKEADASAGPVHTDASCCGDAQGEQPNRIADLYSHPWLHYFSYMRGLDGEVPSPEEVTRRKGGDDGTSTQAQPLDRAERAEGEEQLDYVRRLAHELEDLERDFKAKRKRERIFAIGILGSDLHDKLLILQALRPAFPVTVFFTTDLDARLLDPTQSDWTRGLIVGSAYDLRVDNALAAADGQRLCRSPIPPFRNSYQTAHFFATLAALPEQRQGCFLPSAARWIHGEDQTYSSGYWAGWPSQAGYVFPAAYEIGRGTVVRLPEKKPAAGAPSPWSMVILLAFGGLVLVFSYGSRWMRIATVCLGGVLIILCIVVGLLWAAGLLGELARLVLSADGWKEPFSLSSGVSSWGPIYLQSLALVLSLVFFAYVFFRVRRNALKIERRYFIDPTARKTEDAKRHRRLPAAALHELRSYLRELKSLGKEAVAEARVCMLFLRRSERSEDSRDGPYVVWQRYRGRVTFLCQARRVVSLSVLFFLLVVTLYSATGGGAANPVRGEAMREVCVTLRLLDMFTMALLAFGVLDAALKCRDFIRELAESAVATPHLQWPAAGVNRVLSGEPEGPMNINPWIALSLISEHADEVARLVIYPLIVLALLVVARLSWFDTLTMPVSVLIAYLIFSFYILISAWSMQRAANEAKKKVGAYYASCRQREQIRADPNRQLIAHYECLEKKVEDCKEGAFKPLSQKPLVRAALLPFGALGIGLLDLFGS